ncbi:hypothetical protein JCM10207_005755 [Rhodosporidiobolus poonsookiae]
MSTPTVEPVARSRSRGETKKEEPDSAGSIAVHRSLGGDPENGQDQVKEVQVDAVFGEQGGDDTVNYRSLGWFPAGGGEGILIAKSQIGIGVLAMPGAFRVLGLVPGILILLTFSCTCAWTAYYLGRFKLNHPQVYSVSDAAEMIMGPIGREVFGVFYWLTCTLTTGSVLLTISTAFNAMSLHVTCTAVFVAVAAIMTYPLASIKTLNTFRWVGYVGLVSILSALLLVLFGVAVGGRPSLAPQTGPLDLGIEMFGSPNFPDALNAVASLFFAFTATPAFLPIAAELRDPRDYTKSVLLGEAFVGCFFQVISIVIYLKAGRYVASPALGTAGVLIKRIAYGLALPGLLFTTSFYAQLPAKWMFFRILAGSHHLNHRTKTHWITWFSCSASCVLFAYIVASAIPIFDGLVGLISALTGFPLTFHIEALMYLYDNRAYLSLHPPTPRSLLKTLGIAFNLVLLVVASFLCVGGVYGSVIVIKDSYADGGRPWSCADNSGSV